MAVINTNLVCDLQKAVKVEYIDGVLFSQDNQANQINVTVLDGGEPATISGTVSANIIRSDGGTVAATGGSITGNVASITLPAAAYAVPGVVSIVVKLNASGVITTIAAIVANMYRASTDTAIDPGTIIPSIQTLISQINAAVASIPADYSSLWTKLAPAFSTDASYVAGQYVTYNSGLYRFNTTHTGGWSSSDVTAVNLGGEITDLKSAFSESTGNELIDEYYHDGYIRVKFSTYDITDIGTNAGWTFAVAPVTPGETVVITGTGGGDTARLWAFGDGTLSSGNILDPRADANTVANELELIVPTGATVLICNFNKSYPYRIMKGRLVKNKADEALRELSDNYETMQVNISASSTHSSTADRINFSVLSGESVWILSRRTGTPSNGNALYAKDSNDNTVEIPIIFGKAIKYTASADLVSFGLYVNNASGSAIKYDLLFSKGDQMSALMWDYINDINKFLDIRKLSFNLAAANASAGYIEYSEDTTDIYYKAVTYVINNASSTNKYYSETEFQTDFSGSLVTSPAGETNCLLIEDHKCLVYKFSENKMYLRNTKGLTLAWDEVIFLRNTIGGINNCVLYDILQNKKIAEAKDFVTANADITTEETIQKAQGDCFCVAMQSDTHYKQTDFQKSILQLPGAFSKDIGFDCFVNLGDIMEGYTSRTLAQERQDMSNAVKQYIDTCDVPVMLCKGNHDDATLLEYNEGSKNVNNVILPAEQYARFVKPVERYGINRDPSLSNSLYYYKDFPNNKTRVIVLNCIDVPYENDQDSHMIATGQWSYGFTDDQINWFADTLADIPAGWTAVICSHISLNEKLWTESLPMYNADVMVSIIKAFKNGGSYSNSYTYVDRYFVNTEAPIGTWFDGSVSVDFNGATHNVVCFSGHVHNNAPLDPDYSSSKQGAKIDGIRYIVLPSFAAIKAVDFYYIDIANSKVYLKAYGRTPDETEFAI